MTAGFRINRRTSGLVTLPAGLLATTRYLPVCDSCTLLSVSVLRVAPLSGWFSYSHWYSIGSVPDVETLNVAVSPGKT